MGKLRHRAEFGDFQTPSELADEVCRLVARRAAPPAAVVEPTCGIGGFLVAALKQFPSLTSAVGIEINDRHLNVARTRIAEMARPTQVRLLHDSFFRVDWPSLLNELPQPFLLIGNPPWVTNSELGGFESSNLPKKSNFQGRDGIEAVTGKSNFDISEWMLTHLMEWLNGRQGTLAMLCKTVVARKLLHRAWTSDWAIARSEVFVIDALRHFEANVDACLLLCQFEPLAGERRTAAVFASLDASQRSSEIGLRGDSLVADVEKYDRRCDLAADHGEPLFRWRSGVKHDCAAVMELRRTNDGFENRLGEVVDLEPTFVYPMLKSSEVAQARTESPSNWMIVTQETVGSDTETIKHLAPKTWGYLCSHAERLSGRRSTIYRNRPPFAMFGVGDYTFAPHKVAISGFYKRLRFEIVGSYQNKPIVFDDTNYFLPCRTAHEAQFLAELLNSAEAREFLSAFIFWDAKRPITTEILRRLDLCKLATVCGRRNEFDELPTVADRPKATRLLF